jgi:hypothetical protein
MTQQIAKNNRPSDAPAICLWAAVVLGAAALEFCDSSPIAHHVGHTFGDALGTHYHSAPSLDSSKALEGLVAPKLPETDK